MEQEGTELKKCEIEHNKNNIRPGGAMPGARGLGNNSPESGNNKSTKASSTWSWSYNHDAAKHEYYLLAIKERSSRNKNIDGAMAIKLVLCRAVEK